MTRKYYAAYNHYGIGMAYGPYNCPIIHVFTSRAARDAYVAADRELKLKAVDYKTAHKWAAVEDMIYMDQSISAE